MTPGPIGDPVEAVVVEGEADAVGGDVGVGLEVPVAEGDRRLERRHRVLAGPSLERRPVGEGQRAGVVEERPGHWTARAAG